MSCMIVWSGSNPNTRVHFLCLPVLNCEIYGTILSEVIDGHLRFFRYFCLQTDDFQLFVHKQWRIVKLPLQGGQLEDGLRKNREFADFPLLINFFKILFFEKLKLVMSVRLPVCLSTCLSACLYAYQSACQPICLFVCLSACLFVCPTVYLFSWISFCLYGLRLDRSTARYIYRDKKNLSNRSINPCTKGKMSF
jgi:hypothetical protein